jgi:hypothetical protein
MIRRYCAQDGGCTNPECYLCQEVPHGFSQPLTGVELKTRDAARAKAQKKGRKSRKKA